MADNDSSSVIDNLRTRTAFTGRPKQPLHGGGGGGISDDMDHRVTRVELQMEQTGKTLASIDGKLDRVNDRLMQMPTRTEVTQWKLQWTALSLAVVAIIIGGIIGGLSWIQPS